MSAVDVARSSPYAAPLPMHVSLGVDDLERAKVEPLLPAQDAQHNRGDDAEERERNHELHEGDTRATEACHGQQGTAPRNRWVRDECAPLLMRTGYVTVSWTSSALVSSSSRGQTTILDPAVVAFCQTNPAHANVRNRSSRVVAVVAASVRREPRRRGVTRARVAGEAEDADARTTRATRTREGEDGLARACAKLGRSQRARHLSSAAVAGYRRRERSRLQR